MRNAQARLADGEWIILQQLLRPEPSLCGWTAFERAVNVKRAATAGNARAVNAALRSPKARAGR
jgi:Tfp pilus assembly protein PilX